MKITLTREEMMKVWRERLLLGPLRNDCEITLTEGTDVDGVIGRQIDAWYSALLDTAPVRYLAPTDIGAEVSVGINTDGVGTVELPEGCRRVVAVELHEWERPAVIITDPGSPAALRQTNRFSRGGRASPVAVVEGRRLRLYSVSRAMSTIRTLMVVIRPSDGLYTLDDSALSLIPYYK